MERKMIGYSYSHNLYDIYKDADEGENLIPIQGVVEACDDDTVEFMGVVTEAKQWKSKKGNQTLKLEVEDGRDKITCMAFVTKDKKGRIRDTIGEIKRMNGDKLPVEEDVIRIRGTRKKDAVFMSFCETQNHKIVLKYMDLKKARDSEEAEIL